MALLALAGLAQGGGPAGRLAPPTATIEQEFTRIVGVRELGPDRILVADAGEQSLLVADWSAKTARKVGRTGRGPGEYASVNAIFPLAADTTLLVDGVGSRWILLRGDSIVVTLPPDTPAIQAGLRNPQGADSLGHVVAMRVIPRPPSVGGAGTPRSDSALLLRAELRGARVDTLTDLATRPTRVVVRGTTDADRTVSITFNPISSGDFGVTFPDGWIAVARVAPYRVDWIAPDRKITRGAPLPFERIPVTDREKQAVVDAQALRSGNAPRDPASILDWPEIIPPFLLGSMTPAADGRVWIRRTPSADRPQTVYDVVDRRGARVARFEMGAQEQLIAVGRFAAYTILTDDDGIQWLRRHPLPR
jgi:hypothetical protein